MEPEDAVKASIDVQAGRMLPVHWCTFNLAFHDWDEPIKRAIKAAKVQDVDLVTPRVGEIIIDSEPFNSDRLVGGGQITSSTVQLQDGPTL